MAVLNEEQRLLRDTAKAWVRESAPVSALRQLRDTGSGRPYDAQTWKTMGDMGWAGVLIPEAHGGSAFGYASLGLILEETGRTLTASPLLSTALVATSALLLGGSAQQCSDWLPKIAAGQIVATLAIDEGPHHAPAATALRAVRQEDGWRLSGRKTFVIDGTCADLFIVVARMAGQPGDTHGLTLGLVAADQAGLTVSPLALIDSRGAADCRLDDVWLPDTAVLGQAGDAWPILEAVLDRARAGLAAEMLGTANEAFEQTLAYLQTRTQFGQAIGTFQALQHRAAKMFTELELTRSCVEAALSAIDDGANDVRSLCALAKARAGETLHLITNEMVQMHGGVGMTDAHDAGLYLKRARVVEALFGSASFHRDRYAELAGF